MRRALHRSGLILLSLALLRPVTGICAEAEAGKSPALPTVAAPSAYFDAYEFPNGSPNVFQSNLRLTAFRSSTYSPPSATPPALATAPAPAASNRPVPKPRPRLGRITTDPKDSLTEAYRMKIDLVDHDAGAYMAELGRLIETGWHEVMRAESKDWHPAVQIHLLLRLDPEKGVITVEGQTAPSSPALLARYVRMIESIRPPPFAKTLPVKFGPGPLRLTLDYICAKPPAAK